MMFREVMLITAIVFSLAAAAHADEWSAKKTCTDEESWSFPQSFAGDARSHFKALIEGATEPRHAITDAQAAQGSVVKDVQMFGKYWQARALFAAGVKEMAYERFTEIASQPVTVTTRGIQVAALGCVDRIHAEMPSVELPSAVADQISLYPAGPESRTFAREWAEKLISEGAPANRIAIWIDRLKGNDEEFRLRGIFAASKNDHARTIAELEHYFSRSPSGDLSRLRLLLARAYYAKGKYDSAILNYRKVDKRSNWLPEALSELAWADLMAGKNREATGTATSLQVGLMKGVFAPEAPLVAAITLNELCQFPDSLKAVSLFRASYMPAHDWLKKNERAMLYPIAIRFLKRAPMAGVPENVGSEWLRSPTFLTDQDGIRQLFDEKRAVLMIGKTDIEAELQAHLKRIAEIQSTWTARIERDLHARNLMMSKKLDWVAENAKMVEVEILTGASHDLIFQNAHPDYQNLLSDLQEEPKQQPGPATWNWGRLLRSKERAEVWEDELGSFQAKVFDNCSSKTKYLQIVKR